ncbi:MAG: MFS transporter, partial [Candidatus Thorarchaeota archaeon]
FRPFNVLWPYYINVIHNGTAFDLAFIFGAAQIGNIIGSTVTTIKKSWKYKVRVNLIGESIFFIAYLFVIFAGYQQFYLMMIGVFLGAILFPITVATYLTIFQEVVPSDKIGRAMSIDHTISMAIAPIGAIIAGPAAEFMGITNLYLLCAIIGIINPLFLWYFTKIRKLDDKSEIKIEELPEEKHFEIKIEQKL